MSFQEEYERIFKKKDHRPEFQHPGSQKIHKHEMSKNVNKDDRSKKELQHY